MTMPKQAATDAFLAPGDFYAGFAPARIWTLLGSCVSLVIWHPRRRFGVMSHYLLPSAPSASRHTRALRRPNARYGVDACELTLEALGRADVAPAQCVARIFGGGRMFTGYVRDEGAAVGRRNAEVAYEFIKQNRIRLIGESLFGRGHRRVCFDIGSGAVWEQRPRVNEERAAPARRGAAR